MANDVVMCRPTFFNVTRGSKTNRMMDPENPPNIKLAKRQWTALHRSFKRFGLNVRTMKGQPYLEDMTFVANAGLPVRGRFVLSNFLEEERRGEKEFYRQYFSALCGANKVLSLSDEAIFEGQGDVLSIDRNTLLLGYGVRTNERAVEELILLMYHIDPAIKVVPLLFHPADFYPPDENIFFHLDTCLLHLKKGNRFLVYPRPFQDEAIETLQGLGAIEEITKGEAESFICNSIVAGDAIFAPDISSCQARDIIIASGYLIFEHNMSEFLKSGGAVKCLSLDMCN